MLNQCLLPDWWQSSWKEDLLLNAQKSLQRNTTERRRSRQVESTAQCDGGHNKRETIDYVDATAVVDNESASLDYGVTSAMPDADGGPPGPSLYNANQLVSTFTASHSIDDLSATLQLIREGLGLDLDTFHYHALFRVFNHTQDRENALQLLDVMSQRGETTLETYARAMDCLHTLSPTDALPRLLQVVHLAEKAFGSLIFVPTVGSEATTSRAFRHSRARSVAMLNPDGPAEDDEGAPPCCPILSSLLHHVSTRGGYTVVAGQVVAVWIRSLGAPLSDWDYMSLFSALLSRVEEFPRVRSTMGAFEGFPVGHVSPQAVLDRLQQRGQCSSGSSLEMLCTAMKRSLVAAGVDLTASVEVGVVNLQCTGVRTHISHVLQYVVKEHTDKSTYIHNPALLYHALTQLYSTLREEAEAVRFLTRAVEREEEHRRSLQREGSTVTRLAASEVATDIEPFTVGVHHVLDVGGLLTRLSQRSRMELKEPFVKLSQRFVHQYRESQLQNSLPGDLVERRRDFIGAPHVEANEGEATSCECYALGFLDSDAAAAAALQDALARLSNSGQTRLPRIVRLSLIQIAQYCSRHPRRNCKLTATGLEERRKWGAYLDARDTALCLFGSGQQARDAMKHLYYHDNKLAPLRSSEQVTRDFQDTAAIFFAESSVLRGDNGLTAFQASRSTAPHVRCSPCAVPQYLYDPSVDNPYPHCMLRMAPMLSAASDAEDVFADLWRALMSREVSGTEPWYLKSSDVYVLLMRCLLHRLDWEAAAHLTSKMLEYSTYTYLTDHELSLIFREIGDPAGFLAFKVATKLFDGRIMRDGQTKREQFHQHL